MFDIISNSGVYLIYNKVNNKRYIGSTLNINKRWSLHLYLLRKGKHHSKHLQNAWNKYGEESFVYECLEYCEKDLRLSLEHLYIIKYKTTDRQFGYNVTEDVERVSTFPDEVRLKISLAGTKRKWTEEQRRKFIEANTGRKSPKSSETKKRLFREGTVKIVRMNEVSKEKYDEWCKHISEARKKYHKDNPDFIKAPIMLTSETETLYFPSIKKAANFLGVHRDTILLRIKRGTPSKRIPYTITRISVKFYKSIKNV